MKTEELKEILVKHEKWLNNELGGERANLEDANLDGANLDGANLKYANLKNANLKYANLNGANLDYSVWPLSCKSKNVNLCKKLQAQLLAHAFKVSPDCKPTEEQMNFIKENFHRFKEFWGEEK